MSDCNWPGDSPCDRPGCPSCARAPVCSCGAHDGTTSEALRQAAACALTLPEDAEDLIRVADRLDGVRA